MVSCFLGFLRWSGFHANLSTLNSTWPGPVGETSQSPHRGRAAILFRTTPATIHTIAKTGAMLKFGQERSREKTALAAEPCCAPDCSSARELSDGVSGSYNHPEGVAGAPQNLGRFNL